MFTSMNNNVQQMNSFCAPVCFLLTTAMSYRGEDIREPSPQPASSLAFSNPSGRPTASAVVLVKSLLFLQGYKDAVPMVFTKV